MKFRCSVLLAVTLLGSTALAAPASARRAASTISVSSTHVLQSDPVTVSGRAVGHQRIYRSVGTGGWHRIASVRAGRFHLTVRPTTARTSRYRIGNSRPVTVTSYRCTPLAEHGTAVRAWFNARGTASNLATNWGQLICTAARGSTIRLASMFVWAGDYADDLVRHLRLVAQYRKVHVQVLVDRSRMNDNSASDPKSWAHLRQSFAFATVYSCTNACTVRGADTNMHYKFMTVSRTAYGHTAVVESTLNWSPQQFGRQFGSAIYFHNDARLYNGLVDAFSVSIRKIIATPAVRERGWRTAGPGVAYALDPSTSMADPVSNELSTITCRPGDSVSVVNANVTRGRLVRQLNRLDHDGCSVRMITEQDFRSHEAQYTAARHMTTHDKFVLVRGHDRAGRSLDEVLSGSENFRPEPMLTSQQQIVRVRNQTVVRAFEGWFATQWRLAS